LDQTFTTPLQGVKIIDPEIEKIIAKEDYEIFSF
jgi:hypothetical protein